MSNLMKPSHFTNKSPKSSPKMFDSNNYYTTIRHSANLAVVRSINFKNLFGWF